MVTLWISNQTKKPLKIRVDVCAETGLMIAKNDKGGVDISWILEHAGKKITLTIMEVGKQ